MYKTGQSAKHVAAWVSRHLSRYLRRHLSRHVNRHLSPSVRRLALPAILTLAILLPVGFPVSVAFAVQLVLDDFESYEEGGVPSRWETNNGKKLVPITPELMRDSESFFIHEEDGNKFVRASTVDDAFRIIMTNGNQFEWKLPDHPRISWDWRAIRLPEGAREDKGKKNDTGGAVYVLFSTDFIGRPRAIKYTYSTTLPVGTTKSYGPLKVLVIGTGLDGIGEWQHVERDLYADYQRLFGKTPPDVPLAIFLWSDSDTMDDRAVVDYDNITLHGRVGIE